MHEHKYISISTSTAHDEGIKDAPIRPIPNVVCPTISRLATHSVAVFGNFSAELTDTARSGLFANHNKIEVKSKHSQ
jgi:hypothetical protein